MIQAVRALSLIYFCDELGGQEDLEAVQQGLHAGAAMISTIHAGNIDDLLRKKQGTNSIAVAGIWLCSHDGCGRIGTNCRDT